MNTRRALSRLIAVCLLSLGFGCGVPEGDPELELELAESRQELTARWSLTGSMATPRMAHAAVALPSGKVLVIGGRNFSTPLASAELYDPSIGAWKPAAPMGSPRNYHTATILPNGKVLVTGGWNDSGSLSSTELYNPATNTWSTAASMATAREVHTATLLANGKVLVVGGATYNASAEVYDPATNSWASAGSMSVPREAHFAVRLSNNKVLVGGGQTYISGSGSVSLASAEVYDPATNAWTSAGSMSIPRDSTAAVWVPSLGRVLVTGGLNNHMSQAAADLYDPATNSWSPTSAMPVYRSQHTLTVLNSGLVLAAGGSWSTADVYEPTTRSWSPAGSMSLDRNRHTATLLSNGQVLMVGGYNNTTTLASAELATITDPDLGSKLGANLAQGDTCSAGNTFQPSCGSSSAKNVDYYWTAPASGSYAFTTAGSGYDTVLALADATSGASLGCNDDASATLQSMVVANLTAGQRVRIIVDGYSAACGAFTLNIFRVDGSLGSILGSPVSSGTTCAAGHDSTPSCGGTSTAADLAYLWYAPTSGTFTFTTAGSSFDTVLEVFNVGSNTPIGCNDDANGTYQSSVTASLTAGQAVLVTVDGFGGACGNYQLNVN